MALNLAAQDFIANKLAGTIKDTTKATANQKTSYTDDKYLEVFNAVQTYVTDTKLNDLNKAVATGKFHVVEDIISGYIQQNFPEYANHAATVKELTQRCWDDMTGYSILTISKKSISTAGIISRCVGLAAVVSWLMINFTIHSTPRTLSSAF